MLNVVKYLLIN